MNRESVSSPSRQHGTYDLPLTTCHSVLNDFTGFAIAALIAWKLIVENAINTATNPANPNIHHTILVRYAKSCNHLFIPNHATGTAMINAINTSFINSIDNRFTMLVT